MPRRAFRKNWRRGLSSWERAACPFRGIRRSRLALRREKRPEKKIQRYLEGMEVFKVIFRPNRLLNLVVRPAK